MQVFFDIILKLFFILLNIGLIDKKRGEISPRFYFLILL